MILAVARGDAENLSLYSSDVLRHTPTDNYLYRVIWRWKFGPAYARALR